MLATRNFGLRGVRSLTVDSSTLFVVSAVDEAVSLFSRDKSSGALTYRNHVLNGERLINRFPVRVDTSDINVSALLPVEEPGKPVAWYQGKFPVNMRQGMLWNNSAHSIKHCTVHQKELFIIVTGHSDSTQSSVLIYEWVRSTFIKHSDKYNETSTVHVEHFIEVDSLGFQWHFLVLSNSKHLSSLYRYNPDHDRFFLFNMIPIHLPDGTLLPPHCADGEATGDSLVAFKLLNIEQRLPPGGSERLQGMSQRSHAFRIEGLLYFVVATLWLRSHSGYTWFSYVYKWQTRGNTRVADDTIAIGQGFELFQLIPTDGAVDVRSATLNKLECHATTLLYVTNHGFVKNNSRVQIFQYSRTVSNAVTGNPGAFFALQSMALHGVSTVEPFFSGNEHFLVIAAQFNISLKSDFNGNASNDMSQNKS